MQGVIKTRFFFLDDKAACLISHGKEKMALFKGKGASHLVKGCVFSLSQCKDPICDDGFFLGRGIRQPCGAVCFGYAFFWHPAAVKIGADKKKPPCRILVINQDRYG